LKCGWLRKQLDSKSKFVAEIGNLIGINEMSNAAGMLEKRQLSIGWEAPTLTKHSSRVAPTAGGMTHGGLKRRRKQQRSMLVNAIKRGQTARCVSWIPSNISLRPIDLT
jgi:hypothetical protein